MGRQYSVPLESRPFVLYFRKDVFARAGFPDDPKLVDLQVATWDDFLEVCRTIKARADVPCFASQKAQNNGRLYEMMLAQQGRGYFDAQGNVTVDSPENIATLETLARFWEAGVVSDTLEWTDAWYAELAGRDQPVAAVFDSSRLGPALKTWIAADQPGIWGAARIPAMKAGQARSAGDGGSSLVISAHSHNMNAAWAFVEYLTTRTESQLRLAQREEFFPAYQPSYFQPQFDHPDPFFGGQPVFRLIAETAVQAPAAPIIRAHPSEIRAIVARAVQQVAARRMKPTEALQAATAEIQVRIGQ
jgi:lactose/L-arabinose transport system substrate-binding protein